MYRAKNDKKFENGCFKILNLLKYKVNVFNHHNITKLVVATTHSASDLTYILNQLRVDTYMDLKRSIYSDK